MDKNLFFDMLIQLKSFAKITLLRKCLKMKRMCKL